MKVRTSTEWQAGYREGFMAAQRRAIALLLMKGQMQIAPQILAFREDPPQEFEESEELTVQGPKKPAE